MPVSRTRRKLPQIDMFAMCDVAFLLLLFVMFIGRPRDITTAVDVDLPVSHNFSISDEDGEFLTVYIKNNKVYLGFSLSWLKQQTLMAMAADHKTKFSHNELAKFGGIGNFGDPLATLGGFIKDYGQFNERNHLKGVPIDDTKNNEFFKWISTARSVYKKQTDRELHVYIQGDQNEKYPLVKLVIANLQRQGINKFMLVTQYVSERN